MKKKDKRMCNRCCYHTSVQCGSGGAKWWASGMTADHCSHPNLKEDEFIQRMDKCPADRSMED